MDSFGALTQCMVDGDPEVIRRERKVRRTGLVLSVAIQAALLAALVLIPFLTPAALPHLMSIVQMPIWHPPVVVQVTTPHVTSDLSPSVTYPSPNAGEPTARPRNLNPTGIRADLDFVPGSGDQNANPLNDLLGVGATHPPAPPAIPEAPRKPLSMSSTVMEASLLNRIQPSYPTLAKEMRLSGPVVLSAIIAPDGTIQSLRVVSGSPILAAAAQDAVRQWRYKPTLLNGQPVEVETLITVNFVLN
jgi:periplasmic protein TonB